MHTVLEEHPAFFGFFSTPNKWVLPSPPANIHFVVAVLTLLSCHYKGTISYVDLPVGLHMPFKKKLKILCSPLLSVLMLVSWYRTSLHGHLTYRAQLRQHEVNTVSLSPVATELHNCPTPPWLLMSSCGEPPTPTFKSPVLKMFPTTWYTAFRM